MDIPLDRQLADLETAIRRATKIDELRWNRNFDYDHWAYAEVKAGFERLIDLGQLDEV